MCVAAACLGACAAYAGTEHMFVCYCGCAMRDMFRFLYICVLVLLLCLGPVPETFRHGTGESGDFWGAKAVYAAQAGLNVRSAIVVDVKTGKVLFEKNPDLRIPPASLTKILSMLVALDAVSAKRVSLKDRVRISRNAAGQGGSRMHLKAGEVVSLDRLLMGMAVSSGNDASVAVAEHVAGSTTAFVRQMNAMARRLGMKNTRFENVNGLPAGGQITTARDMSRLGRYYLRVYPSALRYHRVRELRHNGRITTNKNPLLGSFRGADGLKTGWINASGYNIISTARRDGTRLLAVILGAPNSSVRAREIRRLMQAGFEARKQKVSIARVLTGQTGKAAEAVQEKKTSYPKNAVAAGPKKVSPKSAAGAGRDNTGNRKTTVSRKKEKGTGAAVASKNSPARKKTPPVAKKQVSRTAGKAQQKGTVTAQKKTKPAQQAKIAAPGQPRKTAVTASRKGEPQKTGANMAGRKAKPKPLANSVRARRKTESRGQSGNNGAYWPDQS